MNTRWPWVSRARLNDTRAELELLRQSAGIEIARLRTEHEAQIARLRADCEAAIHSVEQDRQQQTDLLTEQITFLRQQNMELLDHVKRVDRASHRMTETVQPPRAAIEPMPPELDAYFTKLGNQALAQERRRQAYRRRGHGESWDQITKDVLPPPEPVETGDTAPEPAEPVVP